MSGNRRDALEEMLRAVEQDTRDTAALTGRHALSPAVLGALHRVARHRFVRPGDENRAYENRPLPIGHGQTISQPFIVALMSDLLDLPAHSKTGARLLEIGAGCGYQSAILGELALEVLALEIHADLARGAAERLHRLGYGNVTVKAGDGALGWPEQAPYDGIVVAAAAPAVPPALVRQLKPGARLVIPLGAAGGSQNLTVITRTGTGKVKQNKVLPVAFVPFTGTKS
ncbi:MAG TPA: protein-L-isoaspartate(D-aspartate) O-methyltransferase [Alphaproteobacteria bacterium]|nr:protein-L-isoaspartate(D-aspartate) O-methyltransferase [Alphaproteobacteria bacterium]